MKSLLTEYAAFQNGLKKYRTLLLSTIECEYGLLSSLENRKLLSLEIVDDINILLNSPRKGSQGEQCLLKALSGLKDKKERRELLSILWDTKQEHISKYLFPYQSK